MSAENYIIERIEELCEKKHMSRYRLAQKSGIAQSSISTLLNRKSVPTIQTLEKICDGETTAGKEVSRFGLSLENGDIKNAIEMLNMAVFFAHFIEVFQKLLINRMKI